MGIRHQLRSVADRVLNRNEPRVSSDSKACRAPNNTRLPDAVAFNVLAQKLEEYFPHPDQREKIGQILKNLGRFAVDSAVSESLKGVTGGIQVYNIVKEGLKNLPSSQPANGNNKPYLTLTMEQLQAQLEKIQKEMNDMKKLQNEVSTHAKPQVQLEKMQEEMNKIKQQNENSALCAAASDPLKEFSSEPTEGSVPLKTEVKRVMIRSRL